MEWYYIAALLITGILGVLGTLFEEKYRAAKKVIIEIADAIEDDQLSKEDVKKIWKKLRKIV